MSKRKHNKKTRQIRVSEGGVRPSRSQGPESTGAPPGQHGGARRGQWIYGRHAASAALVNASRDIHRILATATVAGDLGAILASDEKPRLGRPGTEIVDRHAIDDLLPPGAVHQGLAVLAAPLPDLDVADICDRAAPTKRALVLVLDQASDPHNVGAVMRSAAAFGAIAVITQDRHAPEATGTLAKAASGALEIVPLVATTNISRALKQLKDAGFWCLGLDGEAQTNIADADLSGKIALVLGAEGAGLRRLVKENCDVLVRIPINGAMESLNLSNAAAVALYAAAQKHSATDN